MKNGHYGVFLPKTGVGSLGTSRRPLFIPAVAAVADTGLRRRYPTGADTRNTRQERRLQMDTFCGYCFECAHQTGGGFAFPDSQVELGNPESGDRTRLKASSECTVRIHRVVLEAFFRVIWPKSRSSYCHNR